MKPNLFIERLRVSGFLSFQAAELELGGLNVLIGSNGSGKSNLLRVFELLRAITNDCLTEYVVRAGGADALLHYGRKQTDAIEIEVHFRDEGKQQYNYACRLAPTAHDTLQLVAESFTMPDLREVLHAYRAYHFHDTSESAPVRQRVYYGDNLTLRSDGGNLAAVLLRLQREHPTRYQHLLEVIRLALPFFGDFVLEPLEHEHTLLRWTERGREPIFPPAALPDGGLRYICLMTLLHLPGEWLPPTLLLDEPELGLHPSAVVLLNASLRGVAHDRQIIVATQSPRLVDGFAPEEVVVVERGAFGSFFQKLNPEFLRAWLEEYSTGELWEKNLIGGRLPR